MKPRFLREKGYDPAGLAATCFLLASACVVLAVAWAIFGRLTTPTP